MANSGKAQRGFSLLEMLVALVFTSILMAGMAQVFKSSLGAIVVSNEKTSSSRRNRSSIDLLYDDLNSAGMYLMDLSSSPSAIQNACPAFFIKPDRTITDALGVATTSTDGPTMADELYIYMDQSLPFEGKLVNNTARSAAEQSRDHAARVATDNTFQVDCGDAAYAAMVQSGQFFIFKDVFEAKPIVNTPTVSGSVVTLVMGGDTAAPMTGLGAAAPSKIKHFNGSGVVFVRPAQMVKYCVQYRQLDPQSTVGVPCLVRQQGNYSAAGFTPITALETIITENVGVKDFDSINNNWQAFKVYLSAHNDPSPDALQNTASLPIWAGYGKGSSSGGTTYAGSSVDQLWRNGILKDLDTQIAGSGTARLGYQAGYVQNDLNWFRQVPVLVRVDITTRTANKRTDYSPTSTPTNPTAAYNALTQSLVLVPRHFGLAMK